MFDRRLINKLNEDEVYRLLGYLSDLINSYVNAYNAERHMNEEYMLLLNQSRELQSIQGDIRRIDDILRGTISEFTDKYMEPAKPSLKKED